MDRNVGDLLSGGGIFVALRKESVDRNPTSDNVPPDNAAWSLSARRAWIEIWPVAILLISVKSRSPQGERG